MSSGVTIGTCVWCLKTKSVTLNKGPQLIPGRKEGTCEDCAKMTERQRQMLRDVQARKRRR